MIKILKYIGGNIEIQYITSLVLINKELNIVVEHDSLLLNITF